MCALGLASRKTVMISWVTEFSRVPSHSRRNWRELIHQVKLIVN